MPSLVVLFACRSSPDVPDDPGGTPPPPPECAAVEACGGEDEDCDGLLNGADPDVVADGYADLDGDGHGDPAAPRGCGEGVALADDCDDEDPDTFPEAPEACEDGVDQDCDGRDPDCHTPMDEVLVAAEADVRLRGETTADAVGQAVAGVGDVDGDGWTDFAVGRGWSSDGRSDNAGAVWIVRGPVADGEAAIATTAWATLTGTVIDERAGSAIAGTDGLLLLLGAPGAMDGAMQVGAVYVVDPVAAGERDLVEGTSLRGSSARGGALGTAVAIGGDLDLDGAVDLVAAAPYAGDALLGSYGEVYVFGAGTAGPAAAPDVARTLIRGDPGGQLGGSLAAGDLDGDGLSDLWVADSAATWGFSGPLPSGTIATADAAASVGFGGAVTTPGDTDGDGAPDLWIGDAGAGPAGEGEARLFTAVAGVLDRDDAVLVVVGTVPGGKLGTVATAGDVDGDDVPDLVVAAPVAGAGQAGVFLSPTSGDPRPRGRRRPARRRRARRRARHRPRRPRRRRRGRLGRPPRGRPGGERAATRGGCRPGLVRWWALTDSGGRGSPMRLVPLLVAIAAGCAEPDDRKRRDTDGGPDTTAPDLPATAVDIAVPAAFQGGTEFGHFTRGRSCAVADYDNDGRQDIALGNPGDVSYILRNTSPGPGTVTFELMTVLLQPESYDANSEVAWALQPADYDHDGDFDLFGAMGGIETREFNRLLRNELVPSGVVSFTDVATDAGVLGPLNLLGLPQPTGNAGAQWGDVDQDGWLDLYVGEDVVPSQMYEFLEPTDWVGYDTLYLNRRDGTFQDVSRAVGFWTQEPTRHPLLFDMDNDGDLDLYENNHLAPNYVWMNRFAESGVLAFEEVTDAASLAGTDLHYPLNTFAATTVDLNNDGWEDLIAFVRGPISEGPFTLGHAVLLNWEGQGFVDVTAVTNLNNPFDDGFRSHQANGVMGCSATDVNADGLPDVYIGNGGPEMGWPDQLFVARELVDHEVEGLGTIRVPVFDDWTALIDFPAEEDPDAIALGAEYVPYPYRTHGVCITDFDLDGIVEIAVNNGGTLSFGGEAGSREPNRLFQIRPDEPGHWLVVHPIGDGVAVNRDAIGARISVVGLTPDGEERAVYLTMRGGNAFSAQNGFDLFFGLGDAVAIDRVEIMWPDGHYERLDDVPLDQRVEVYR